MASVGKVQETHHAERTATILAIGTANPAHCVYQADSPDLYFRITKSEHLVELKEKYKRICEKTNIKKRYTFLTEEVAKAHPNIFTYKAPSYDTRQDLLIPEVPKLGHEAALKAIKEWGQPVSRITHLVVSTSSGIDMPGADYQLTKLLGLKLTTKRYMIYQQGCFSGAAALRLAKDLAENNTDSRVLVVCSELLSTMFFHAPSTHVDDLLGAAIFGDGAASVIIGANPDISTENPLFKMEFTTQLIIPNSDGAMGGHLREMGATYYIKPSVPHLFGSNVEKSVVEAFSSIGISDWNSLFYIVHPGGPVILDLVEKNLKLKKDKLGASWEVLKEYGNMGGPSVIFALDEMRKKSMEDGKATTGDGMEWGVLIGMGPGITMEIIVLRSVPTVTTH